ncbi:hypothetical protein [Vitiosangium sp. GDMCC 1.1324]|uniref:hypothetical protein n=1 Tax=Vitiosangium sp. (strain GDMCC 1.1324) TaxID=2138576 RepID=UPI000D35BF18|nr:hypothetical protein [Vitiosangium sp. GDMCC 1.1324]PTL80831.1 hypothetical protein DAT35_26185 [Vitiosangium sp. GDMCC 1.1324]
MDLPSALGRGDSWKLSVVLALVVLSACNPKPPDDPGYEASMPSISGEAREGQTLTPTVTYCVPQ